MRLEETSDNYLEYETFIPVHFILSDDCEVVWAQIAAFL